MAQSLNPVQKALVNETVRPAIEKIVAMRYYLAALVAELDNQQTPIVNNTEVLNDDRERDAARDDAPTLTGQNLNQLRNFAQNMVNQIDGASLNALIRLMVRDVDTVTRNAVF